MEDTVELTLGAYPKNYMLEAIYPYSSDNTTAIQRVGYTQWTTQFLIKT